MAPIGQGEVGEVFIARLPAVTPQLLADVLHVNSVLMDDGIEGEARAAQDRGIENAVEHKQRSFHPAAFKKSQDIQL